MGRALRLVWVGMLILSCMAGRAWGQFPRSPVEAASAERGGRMYAEQCASCHGEDTRGTAKGPDMSTVEWSSTYTPDQGKEAAAETAIGGIYQAGLDNIQKVAAK